VRWSKITAFAYCSAYIFERYAAFIDWILCLHCIAFLLAICGIAVFAAFIKSIAADSTTGKRIQVFLFLSADWRFIADE